MFFDGMFSGNNVVTILCFVLCVYVCVRVCVCVRACVRACVRSCTSLESIDFVECHEDK